MRGRGRFLFYDRAIRRYKMKNNEERKLFFHFVKVEEQKNENCTAPVLGNNKVYDIIPCAFEKDGTPVAYECFWGRISEGYCFGNPSAYAKMRSKKILAQSLAETIKSRLAHGYKDMTSLVTVDEGQATDEAKKDRFASVKNSKVKGLFNKLFDLARGVVAGIFKSQTITKKQALFVEALLNQMSLATSVEDFNTLYKKVLYAVPRQAHSVEGVFAHKQEQFAPIIDRERALLDNLRTVSGDEIETEIGDKLIVSDEVSERDITLIKKMLGSHAAEYKTAWKVQNLDADQKFASFKATNKVTKTTLLWHGTRGENVLSILRTGLKLHPQAKTTGKMFGWGIYFALSADKSLGYTDGGRWARGARQESRYLILNEVITGTEYQLRTPQDYCKRYQFNSFKELNTSSVSQGCHSLHAFGGQGMQLKADEIVVYDEAQVRPLFLVELE